MQFFVSILAATALFTTSTVANDMDKPCKSGMTRCKSGHGTYNMFRQHYDSVDECVNGRWRKKEDCGGISFCSTYPEPYCVCQINCGVEYLNKTMAVTKVAKDFQS